MSLASAAEFAGPLLAASAGSLVAEKSGRTNMALEGLVTAGAFCAAAAARSGAPPVLALAAAIAASGAVSLVYSLFLSRTRADPVISGIALNLLVPAAVAALAEAVSGSAGLWRFGSGADSNAAYASLAAGGLAYAAAWLFLVRTRDGLRIRAAGSSEAALVSAGGSPDAARASAFLVSGAGAGLAGGLMALSLGAFSPGMSSGRGWLAIASVYAGRKQPLPSLLAALAFIGADALAVFAQSSLPFPHELSSSIPPLVALAALGIAGARKAKTPL